MPLTKNKNITKRVTKGLRIPRPLGLTLKTRELTNIKDTDQYNQKLLYTKIALIEQWTSNGFMLNGITTTQEDLSNYLNLPIALIVKYMWKAMEKMGRIWNKGPELEEKARALFSIALKKGLEIQSLGTQQVAILMGSQAGEYKAFISATVNQALANLNATQAPIHKMLEMITSKTNPMFTFNTLIGTPQGHGQGTGTPLSLNQEGAMRIINEGHPSMLEDPLLASSLIEKYRQAGLLPDTNPRTQNVGEICAYKLFDDGDGNKDEDGRITSHENRRKVMEGVVDIEDADMFKA